MKFYYIQASGTVGNCALWWMRDRRGYTTDLNNAGLYEESEARSIVDDPSRQDVAWPVSTIDRIAQFHVDVQYLPDRYLKFRNAPRIFIESANADSSQPANDTPEERQTTKE